MENCSVGVSSLTALLLVPIYVHNLCVQFMFITLWAHITASYPDVLAYRGGPMFSTMQNPSKLPYHRNRKYKRAIV